MRGRVNQDPGVKDGRHLTENRRLFYVRQPSQLDDHQGGRASWQVELQGFLNMSDDPSETDVDVLTADAARCGRWYEVVERKSVLDHDEQQHGQ